MSEVTGCDLVGAEYPARLQLLLAHGIGLWDVVGAATREGSLNSKIRLHANNDLVQPLIQFIDRYWLALSTANV